MSQLAPFDGGRMSSISNWDWFWAGEHGRDRLLREQADEAAAVAAATSSRLTSRLNRLQGSLEKRLDALSAAFDAYVELGDVREQLNAMPDTRAGRAEVARVMEELIVTGRADPIDDTGATDLWLIDAMNAVIDRVEGRGVSVAEERATTSSPEALMLIALVLGGLDRGDLIADQLPRLLLTDGSADDQRRALWNAIVAGCYGPDALSGVAETMEPHLRAADDWDTWQVGETDAKHTPADTVLALVDIIDAAEQAPGTQPPASDGEDREALGVRRTAALRTVQEQAAAMASGGTPEERALRQRADELRERIEHPEAALERQARQRRHQGRWLQETDDTTTSFSDLVRADLSDDSLPLAVRAELARWVLPHLRPAVTRMPLPAPATRAESAVEQAQGVEIQVTAEGPDVAQRNAAVEAIRAEHAGALSPWLGGGIAALGLVATIIGMVLGSGPVAVIGIVILLTGGVGARILYRRAQEQREAVEFLVLRLDRRLRERAASLRSLESTRREESVRAQGRQAALDAMDRLVAE